MIMALPYTFLAGLAGTVALAAGSPAAGSPAAAMVSPVHVVSCDYTSSASELQLPGVNPIRTNDLRISFVNHAPLAATDVRFAVSYGNDTTQIADGSGTFSGGTEITRDFTPSVDPGYRGGAQCAVQSVTFSDGSIWQRI